MPDTQTVVLTLFLNLLNKQGESQLSDLWEAVKCSQHCNEARSFFIYIAENWRDCLSASDSLKLGDKLIPALRTFNVFQQQLRWYAITAIFSAQETKEISENMMEPILSKLQALRRMISPGETQSC